MGSRIGHPHCRAGCEERLGTGDINTAHDLSVHRQRVDGVLDIEKSICKGPEAHAGLHRQIPGKEAAVDGSCGIHRRGSEWRLRT